MIRSIFTLLIAIVFLYVLFPLLIIEWIIGKFNPGLMHRSSLKMVQAVFRMMMFTAGVDLTVVGRENIPDDEPVLYVANHRSYFDIIIGYTLVKGECGFISKKEMRAVPLLGIWMDRLHCLFLDRQNPREALTTILTGIDYLKAGKSMWIFPEGTRSPGNDMLPFKEGSLKLASKSKRAVVPVTFLNTDDVLENHMPFCRKTKVTVVFGEPIRTADLSRGDLKLLAPMSQDVIRKTLEELTGQTVLIRDDVKEEN
ncbi:MAG: 1-acyl-sn-glycerol-3-phosphate acyltransferase [Lachnospiraceae bacterium]|nr:1-acyl-sn-glycerol-3-phosphate acyltransferase [Lachnospiraceae bacterium]